jgi:hypothetical protein
MTQNANTPPAGGQAPPQGDPPGQAPTTTPPQVGDGQSQQQSLSQEEMAKVIADLRKENAAHRNKAKEQERLAQEAEAERLRQQGEYKALAEKHETRVKELEPIAESYTRLASTMNAQIEAEIKDWPPEVKSLVPAADVPVESRLEHMNRLRPLLEKLQVQARGTSPGNSPNPRPQAQTAEGAGKEYMQRLLDTGKYGRA